jgi:tetratricopeptide (TPR) repeat protein
VTLLAAAGCQPVPFHLDPLSVNGRDGGGSPPSYEALMRIATAARSGGDYANAVAINRRAAEIQPGAAAPFVGLSDTLIATGAVNEAILAYNSALARDGGNLPAKLGLARAYLQTGRPELAQVPLSRALADNPNDPKLLVLLGLTQDVEGGMNRRKRIIGGLQGAPGDPALTVDLALSLALAEAARLGRIDLDEAAVEHNLAYYQTLRALSPDARDHAILSVGSNRSATGPS